jgi:oxygen-independent coproporphyrinogen-3 oxidase
MPLAPFQSLYVHIPFCEAKCDYCAFYSETNCDYGLRQQYLHRLEEEFSLQRKRCLPLRSVFLGGGTPSTLSDTELTLLLAMIHSNFNLLDDCEFSLEANPHSLDAEKLRVALDYGVNRLSLGIQSFNPILRQTIGRRGSLDNLPEIIARIKEVPEIQLNLDLIFNIPGQTLADWQSDLRLACAIKPDHLSTYALMIEKGTPLAKRNPATCSDDEFCAFWKITDDILNSYGLERYEISNFASPKKRCRHNFEIWHGQTYLGCGPAAVSFDGVTRSANPDNLRDWLDHASPIDDILAPENRAAEILAFGLRTTDGWKGDDFQQLTNFDPWQLKPKELEKLARLGLLEITATQIRPTRKGLLYNDDILEMLI